MTPRLLDLFCGAGGAAMGYAQAGFEVVGVDIAAQPRYPFEFHQADAMAYPLDGFDVIHASPPCQAYSQMGAAIPALRTAYPKMIAPVRARLNSTRVLWVIENVEGARADMNHPVMLCASMFGLETSWPGIGRVGLRRHRLFETNWPLSRPPGRDVLFGEAGCDHRLRSVPVYGHGGNKGSALRASGPGFANASREVMGIDWMSREEMNEAIPPAYTEYVGRQLLGQVLERRSIPELEHQLADRIKALRGA